MPSPSSTRATSPAAAPSPSSMRLFPTSELRQQQQQRRRRRRRRRRKEDRRRRQRQWTSYDDITSLRGAPAAPHAALVHTVLRTRGAERQQGEHPRRGALPCAKRRLARRRRARAARRAAARAHEPSRGVHCHRPGAPHAGAKSSRGTGQGSNGRCGGHGRAEAAPATDGHQQAHERSTEGRQEAPIQSERRPKEGQGLVTIEPCS